MPALEARNTSRPGRPARLALGRPHLLTLVDALLELCQPRDGRLTLPVVAPVPAGHDARVATTLEARARVGLASDLLHLLLPG